MNCCNWYGCFVKTNAFIVALLSIGVLTLSTIILISSVSFNRENISNGNDAHSPDVDPVHGPDQNDENGQDSNMTTNSNSLGNTTQLEHNPLYISSPAVDNPNGTNGTAFPLQDSNQGKNSTSLLSSPSQSVLSERTLNLNSGYAGEGADGVGNSNQMSTTESSTTTTSISSKDGFFDRHFNFWKGKSDTFIHLMQASSGTGIFAGFLQLAFSWFLICGSTKDLKERTKLWNLSNLIVFILLVVIILVPLSYNTTTNTFKGSKAFMREIYRRIKSLEEFSGETLEMMWSSVSNFLEEDLTLFYYVMGADALILLGFLLPALLCCLCYPCGRCCCKRKSSETDSDSDLMLFGPGPNERY